ncbi:MAG: rare lipoprotein [Verrucomicrobiota bacterium]|jgi:rare lipoprotein A (peptidoglycan hydrolase)
MKAWLPITLLIAVAISPARSSDKPRDVYAVWYKVPPLSLAHRRAGPNEFTAAHNRLPLGTLVRLTNLENGHSVIVRITDRGLPHIRAKIDICKEAAESLGFLRQGTVRVRMEVVPSAPASATSDGAAVVAH